MKKYVNSEYVEMTEEEIAHIEELLKDEPVIEQTIEERITKIEEDTEILTACMLEMSELVYV